MQARTLCCQVEDVKWEEDEEADLGRGPLFRCRQFVKSGKGDGVGEGPGVDLRGGLEGYCDRVDRGLGLGVGLGVGDLRAGDLLQWAAQRMAHHSPGFDTGASWPAWNCQLLGLKVG
jgi:hypothetical protein